MIHLSEISLEPKRCHESGQIRYLVSRIDAVGIVIDCIHLQIGIEDMIRFLVCIGKMGLVPG